jgi:FkbM family methyltransferase
MAARIRGLAPAAAFERAGAVAAMAASAEGRRALRWRPRSVAAWRLVQGVVACGVHPGAVIDVGANAGQFARAAVELLRCPVHSFEPLPAAADAFARNLADRPQVRLHRVALGASSGSIAFYPHEYTLASSALPRELDAGEAWTNQGDPIDVPVARLDEVLAVDQLTGPVLLKLDVQGYEAEVLAGAPRVLADAGAVLVELAFVSTYQGQPLAADLVEVLADQGWRLHEVLDVRRADGRIAEVDALFLPAR